MQIYYADSEKLTLTDISSTEIVSPFKPGLLNPVSISINVHVKYGCKALLIIR